MTVAEEIYTVGTSPSEMGRDLMDATLVDGLFAISRSIRALAASVDRLGTNNGVHETGVAMGGLELLSFEMKNGMEAIARALEPRSSD